MKDHGIFRDVRRQDRHHIALAETPIAQPARQSPDARLQRPGRHLAARGTVDQHHPVGVGTETAQDAVGDAFIRQPDRRKRAGIDHGVLPFSAKDTTVLG
ncbi:MAG: hypothetical protein FD150_1257 [Rhodobacteraceae bacterium]|nr:MAG: hypothetical protein FD150_1257 [Paracoccaceae bacterium]